MNHDEKFKSEQNKCGSEKQFNLTRNELISDLPVVANPFENCRNVVNKEFPENNMRYAKLNQINLHMLYELKKCKKIQDNNAKTSIENILEDYEWIKQMAGRLRCMSSDSRVGYNSEYFLYEMGTAEMVLSLFSQYK